ncbi:hypothetical protein SADUNF_Sadunf15G0022800 [Salix dunnii]|uniref:Bulb-type lectin domain-containing protein n=1 Tax=Salix dunnii TaxID=1413687 RepID=A0A835JHU8_9ROSI|nr:hypothetical protein SADUNF_Sadunf15G0022800 [Salix dunnii]
MAIALFRSFSSFEFLTLTLLGPSLQSAEFMIMATCLVLFLSVLVWLGARAGASHIGLGSRLLAQSFLNFLSDNLIYRNSLVNKNAFLELDTTGNLVLIDGERTVWMSNTSGAGITSASMEETGNFILHTNTNHSAWQSFEHPSDTLLPNQPLTVSLELTSPKSTSQGAYYSLKMLQQPTSLSLALTYNLPETYDASPEAYANFSYWPGPDISNVTGDVVAVLDDAGSFGIVYGESSNGAVYVYKNDGDYNGLESAPNQSSTRPAVLRRLILETNGNLRLYRWDNNVNGSREWVAEWAAVSNPCDIAGICGNGVCSLDRSKTNASCTCLPGTSKAGGDNFCAGNSSSIGGCDSQNANQTSEFRIASVQQTSYYFSDFSVIANYSDIPTVSKCGDACLSDCECVASVYGLDGEKPYCWILRSLDFGGYEDTGSTLFVKVKRNESTSPAGYKSGTDDEDTRKKAVIIPLVLGMTILLVLLCLLLYYNVHNKRYLKRAMESSHILPGAPIHFTYRDLLIRTCNFSQLLGTEDFFYPGWAFKAMMNDTPLKAADRRLEGSVKEEELVYKAMKRDFNQYSSFTTATGHPSSHATCSYSTMSPR